VAAVDRYAVADDTRPAEHISAETTAAMELGLIRQAPFFDASALRQPTENGSRKLGLGSSAAMVVAALGLEGVRQGVGALGPWVLPQALAAHRRAQGGGSGIDIAASSLGGVLVASLRTGELCVAPHALPHDLVVRVYAAPQAAVTATLLGAVRSFGAREPRRHAALMEALGEHAAAAQAAESVPAMVAAFDGQMAGLAELGRAAGVTIVTRADTALRALAQGAEASFGPSGAGGGDVALYVGPMMPSQAWQEAAARWGYVPLDATLGAPGVGLVEEEP
jgi:phosphomevalonate kinase